ncbi:HipA domain-containing protein [Candidatus Poriferisodalis sp.]|uniref:HipA domain-containing protein n=1 Tax=Candidatus Poriferisodalis sp. TaxID=3101277 RepID=UPI003B0245A9
MTPAALSVRVGGIDAATISRAGTDTVLTYHAGYLAHPDAVPLSLSLPMRIQPHAGAVVENWLDGLLPDLPADRERWRASVGAASVDPFDLLATPVGAECAGAVQFEPDRTTQADSGAARPAGHRADRPSALEPIADADLAAALGDLSESARFGGWRMDPLASFSLAGTMPKLALRRIGGQWHRAVGEEPTSHILKPSVDLYPGQAIGEHLALATARALGIDAARSEVAVIGGFETLITQRYDRVNSAAGSASLARIHQEDMCQALSHPPARRFQRDGGPSPADIAGLLRTHSSDTAADIEALLRRLVYCWVIVANDAHGKNHALLHLPGGVCRLAPLYDTASWLPYTDVPAPDIHLAMALGDGYQVGVGARIDDWRDAAQTLGADPDWAVAEVERIARETPARLTAEIDNLPTPLRASGTPTRLLSAITLRSQAILAG